MLYLEYSRTVLKNLLLPPADLLLLAFFGLWWMRRQARLGYLITLIALAGLWLLSTPVIADALTRATERYAAFDATQPVDAQAIVILGGGGQRSFAAEYGGPAAEPYLLEKLAYGAYLARQTGLPILVTGFQIEATAMSDSLQRNFGIRPRWVDDQAYDTFENARNSVRLLRADGVRRVILVTRATHLWRSAQEFARAGMPVVPAPVGIVAPHGPGPFPYLPDAEALEHSYAAVYEALGEQVREFLAWSHLRRQ